METFGHQIESFPADAEVVVEERYEGGQPYRTKYYLGGQLLGNRYWSAEGEVEAQFHFRGDKPHGPWYEFQDGYLSFITHYVDGLEHGVATQYCADGRVLGRYEMVHGTGIDLWYSGGTGLLAEEREVKNGRLHGFERWWDCGEGGKVAREGHFKGGLRHGIFREWEAGGLADGFPKFFVDDEAVGRERYLLACADDAELPEYRVQDDAPARDLLASPVKRDSLG